MLSKVAVKVPYLGSLISNRPTLQKVLDNIGWLTFDKIFRLGVGLFVMGWIARYLGPEQFGLWNYAIAFTSLFTAFATLGLDGIVVRELVKHPEKTEELLGTAFVLRLIGGLIAFILSIGGAFLLGNTDTLTLLLIALSAGGFVFQAFMVIDYYNQAKIMSKYTVWAQNGAFLIMSVVKIVLVIIKAPLIAFGVVGLLEIILGSIFLVVLYNYQGAQLGFGKLKKWRFSFSLAVDLLKYSFPLFLSGIVLMIQARIDQVFLKNMVGDRELAYYTAALKIIEVFAFVPMMLKDSFFPIIQKTKTIYEFLAYKDRLIKLYRLYFTVFLLLAIPIFLFSEHIVFIIYGAEYILAAPLLALMVVRLFFAFMGVARGIFLLTENLISFSFYTMLAGTIINIILNIYLIPDYGSYGAIISSLISFFVSTFLVDLFFDKTRTNLKWQIIGMLTFYKLRR